MAALYWDESNLEEVCKLSNGTEVLEVKSGFVLEPGNKCQKGKQYPAKKLGCEGNMNVLEEIEWEFPIFYPLMGGVLLCAFGYLVYWKFCSQSNVKYSQVSSSEMTGLNDVELEGENVEQHFGFDDFEDDLINRPN